MIRKEVEIVVKRKGVDNQGNKWRLMSDSFFSKNSVYACARERSCHVMGERVSCVRLFFFLKNNRKRRET